MSNDEVAAIILKQMGGINKISAMVGGSHFARGDDSIQFKFKNRRGPNHVKVKLEADDTYTVTFARIRGLTFKKTDEFEMVYADMLIGLFETTTGLRLSL